MVDAYMAIMKAADSIEREPRRFNFQAGGIYDPVCATPMCALGWIGAHADSTLLSFDQVPDKVLGMSRGFGVRCFYLRMDRIQLSWRYNPSLCAGALRIYAEIYHKPPKTELPAQVKAIFEKEFADA
jgi:hypothetical protein